MRINTASQILQDLLSIFSFIKLLLHSENKQLLQLNPRVLSVRVLCRSLSDGFSYLEPSLCKATHEYENNNGLPLVHILYGPVCKRFDWTKQLHFDGLLLSSDRISITPPFPVAEVYKVCLLSAQTFVTVFLKNYLST